MWYLKMRCSERVGGGGRSLEIRITGACIMIFPGGIMPGIGDELETGIECSF